jgi:hypothetical protein
MANHGLIPQFTGGFKIMKDLYIFDIDGTLANLEHRLHFIKQKSPDWDSFHNNVIFDQPIKPVITTCQMLSKFCDIWYFTGRMECCRGDTIAWLHHNVIGFEEPNLTMRNQGDTREDFVIKQEMLHNMLHIDRDRLVAVFDDRQQVVDMFRSNGIQVFQCAKGNF